MRPKDWEALKFALNELLKKRKEVETGKRKDYRHLRGESDEYRIPAATFLNAVTEILSSLSSNKSLGAEQHAFAIAAVKLLGPQKSVSRAERNQEIRHLSEKSAHGFFQTKAECQDKAAGKFALSSERIRKIESGTTSALEQFLAGDISPHAMLAGEKALFRIRKAILSKTGKGEAMRSLAVIEFANIGASELQAEIVQDVDALVAAGVTAISALQKVAENHGLSVSKVRSAYQRAKESERKTLNEIRSAEAARRFSIE